LLVVLRGCGQECYRYVIRVSAVLANQRDFLETECAKTSSKSPFDEQDRHLLATIALYTCNFQDLSADSILQIISQ
jgi:hypothetical protein